MGNIGKWFLNSKTFWFNALAFLVAVAGNFGFVGFTPDAHLAEYITVAVAVINILLRFATAQPISLSKPITFGALKGGAPKR